MSRGCLDDGFVKPLKDITPLGCFLSADFEKKITKTGWRSMQTTPVDIKKKWRHVGLGMDKALHPFLKRKRVAQANTAGEQ